MTYTVGKRSSTAFQRCTIRVDSCCPWFATSETMKNINVSMTLSIVTRLGCNIYHSIAIDEQEMIVCYRKRIGSLDELGIRKTRIWASDLE